MNVRDYRVWLLVIIVVGFVAATARLLPDVWVVLQHSRVEGTATRITDFVGTDGLPVRQLDFTFRVNNQVYRDRAAVSAAVLDGLQEGDPLLIYYPPGDPTDPRPRVGQDLRAAAPYFFLTITGIALVLLSFFSTALFIYSTVVVLIGLAIAVLVLPD